MSDSNDLGLVNGPEVTGSQTQAFIDALKGGANLSIDRLDSEPDLSTEEETEVEAAEVEVAEDTESPAESLEPEVEEEVLLSSDSEKEEPASPSVSDILEINITDDKGRRKVKVDFSDKDKLTKFVQLAYGARKWQKERDDLRGQLEEKTQMWDKFEEAWKGGYRGLINTLEGAEDAFDKVVEAEIARRQELEDMSPAQRQSMEVEDRIRKQQMESDKLKSQYEKKLQEIQAKEEAASQKELESRIHPAFDRYRFAGKLNDEVAEHEFDTMLWQRTLAKLESLPDTQDITQAVIDREFRNTAQMMRKHLAAQAEKTVKSVIEQKKQVAANKVQAAAKRNVVKSQTKDEIHESLRSGNIVDGLSKFFKSGGKLSR